VYYTPSGRSIQASGIVPDIELKLTLLPPKPEEAIDKSAFVREKDLKGHMPNHTGEEPESEKSAEEKESEKKAKAIIENDNQVRHALQLLQSWSIFSKLNTRS
jgi:carboxyl-terminal processing protease